MKFTRYSRYTGESLDWLDLEQLVGRLSDFLLQSGFENQYYGVYEMDPSQTMEQLREAVLRAMLEGDMIPPETTEQLLGDGDPSQKSALNDLLDSILEKLAQEGYISPQQPPQITPPPDRSAPGHLGPAQDRDQRDAQTRFEITDKALDFLGYKTLRDLLASLGKSSFGRHDTRDLATGIESSGASRAYEFGDTLNLDVSETLFRAIRRSKGAMPIEIDYPDLMVHQAEYQSSCATVLMLDCSHSMILYGEDRFTPAKKVALALSHLIRTQYPGDSLRCVLFHDTAEGESVNNVQQAKENYRPGQANARDQSGTCFHPLLSRVYGP